MIRSYPPLFRIGDAVCHAKYGIGMVIKSGMVDDGFRVKVRFSDVERLYTLDGRENPFSDKVAITLLFAE